MSRRDKQQAQEARRLIDDLTKALQRRDALLAAEALQKLPAGDRGNWLSQVQALATPDLERATQANDPPRLYAWAVRTTAEPRLVAEASQCWALAWAAVRVRDWSRAAVLMARSQPDLAASDHPWDKALAVWWAARGEPEAATFAAALPLELRTLLVEPVTTAADIELPPPSAPSEVEDAVLRASVLPWPAFAAAVQPWLRGPHGAAVAQVAARVAVAEALRRHCRRAAWDEPVAWLADAARMVAPAEMPAADVANVLRLAQAATATDVDLNDPPPRGLAAAVQLAVRHPGLRAMAVALVDQATEHWFDVPQLSMPWSDLIALVCGDNGEPRAVWLALERVADGEGQPPPAWLCSATSRCLQADPKAFGAAQPAADDLEQVLDRIAWSLPGELAADVLDAVWHAAPEAAHMHVAEAVHWLIERLSVQVVGRGAGKFPVAFAAAQARHMMHWSETDDDEVLDLLLELAGPELGDEKAARLLMLANRALIDGGNVAPLGRTIWQRFRQRAVPLHIRFLEVDFRIATDDAACLEAMRWWGKSCRDPDQMLDALELLRSLKKPLVEVGIAALLEGTQETVDGLAALVFGSSVVDLPLDVQRENARLFMQRLDSHVGARSQLVDQAAAMAEALLAPPQASKAKHSKPKATKAKDEPGPSTAPPTRPHTTRKGAKLDAPAVPDRTTQPLPLDWEEP